MRLRLCMSCRQHLPADRFKGGSGSCLDCARKYQRDRDKRRGTSTQRGYGPAWGRLRDQLVAEHVQVHGWNCPGLNRAPHPSTDLTVDHIVEKVHGGTDDRSNLRVVCTDSNTRRTRSTASREPRPRFSRRTLTGTGEGAGIASNKDSPRPSAQLFARNTGFPAAKINPLEPDELEPLVG
jgi:5-methylcytosine-specific restriction protein A